MEEKLALSKQISFKADFTAKIKQGNACTSIGYTFCRAEEYKTCVISTMTRVKRNTQIYSI